MLRNFLSPEFRALLESASRSSFANLRRPRVLDTYCRIRQTRIIMGCSSSKGKVEISGDRKGKNTKFVFAVRSHEMGQGQGRWLIN